MSYKKPKYRKLQYRFDPTTKDTIKRGKSVARYDCQAKINH